MFWTLETPLTRISFSLLLTVNQLVPSVFQILKDARQRRYSNALLKSIVEVETEEFEKRSYDDICWGDEMVFLSTLVIFFSKFFIQLLLLSKGN